MPEEKQTFIPAKVLVAVFLVVIVPSLWWAASIHIQVKEIEDRLRLYDSWTSRMEAEAQSMLSRINSKADVEFLTPAEVHQIKQHNQIPEILDIK